MSIYAECISQILRAGTQFANVDDTTDDPKILRYPSWIGLWKSLTGNEAQKNCCACGQETQKRKLKGGHISLGSIPVREDLLKSRHRTFIAPICDHCNGTTRILTAVEDTQLVRLFGYKRDGKHPDFTGSYADGIEKEIDGFKGLPLDPADEYILRASHASTSSLSSSSSSSSLSSSSSDDFDLSWL